MNSRGRSNTGLTQHERPIADWRTEIEGHLTCSMAAVDIPVVDTPVVDTPAADIAAAVVS